MSSKTLKRIGFFLLFELLAVLSSLGIGHGRIQDFLAWVTGWQLIIIFFVVLIVWIVKHKDKYYKNPTTLNKSGAIRIMLATFLIIGLIVGWVIGLFPELVRFSLQHYGADSLATVQSYELVHQGSRGAEFEASSVTDADALNVKLSYNDRISAISIQKGDPAFDQVYNAATQTGDDVPVRYLSWMPAIVLPKSDLGLPNSANVKPYNPNSGTSPTLMLPNQSQQGIPISPNQ